MKNKQHEYLLKAFMNSAIPIEIKNNAPELIIIDSIIGGYCAQILKGSLKIKIVDESIISKETKKRISNLIDNANSDCKEELVFYYRLALLTESVIQKYT